MFDYISVCSGIEAASVAWEGMGAKPICFSEIDAFPAAVLRHHWPCVVNVGDMTILPQMIRHGLIPAAEVLIGGTPCQSYSVAGLRKGLDDPRGQLTLSWVDSLNALDSQCGEGNEAIGIWENVPGVLSDVGNAFGEFLGKLAGEDGPLQPAGKKWTNSGCVFGPQRAIAWRIVDAQYFGVAQRRRRVFLVASARKGFNPCEVLFEFEGVRRDTPPSREKKEIVASLTANGVGACGADDNQAQAGYLVPRGYRMTAFGEYADDETASTMKARDYKDATAKSVASVIHGTQDPIVATERAHALGRNNGQENAVVFEPRYYLRDNKTGGAPSDTVALTATNAQRAGDASPHVAYAFAENSRAEVRLEGGDGQRTGALSTGGGKAGQGVPTIAQGFQVRRLMPSECATLQGFPKNHCVIPWRNGESPDGAQYKAYGNSMAVPCIKWIGERLIKVIDTTVSSDL